jgi:hypothetical protein
MIATSDRGAKLLLNVMKLSHLSYEKLGRIFGVSARQVYLWTKGKRMLENNFYDIWWFELRLRSTNDIPKLIQEFYELQCSERPHRPVYSVPLSWRLSTPDEPREEK